MAHAAKGLAEAAHTLRQTLYCNAPAVHGLNANVVAVEQGHADKWIGVCGIRQDVARQAIPYHSRGIGVELRLAAVSKNCAAPRAKGQAERINQA